MARRSRRAMRSSIHKSPEPSAVSTPSTHTPSKPDGSEPGQSQLEDDACPECKRNIEKDRDDADKENWVRCDACKTWFHWRCAGDSGDLELIDKWFCKPCMEAELTRVITVKPPTRKSSRKRPQRDYANLHVGLESDPNKWTRILQGKAIKDSDFRRMKGSDLGIEWLENDDNAMREPIVVESPDGLGMKMPPKHLTVDDVAELVGEETLVEVIDVASQSTSPGWTLGKWAEYFKLEHSARDKILNVISMEVSGTKLADKIMPPRLVRELDWVEKFWPNNRKSKGHTYPKVQLYCLMGVATAWTDWHIDFAGSSVYYHILHGSKIFYFIRPSQANLAAYERWSGTDIQNHSWLGDMVDEVFKVELHAGNTMVIPTGWIHAVYTPVDTVVFGGNFLHSYNVATQLKVRDIELATHVPKKFRFPLFTKLCWYVGDKYLRDLKAKEEFSPRVLESIEALAGFLVSEVRNIERGTDQVKRESREQVPTERVKDAAAMARELRWRVRTAAGHCSDDDESDPTKAETATNGHTLNGVGSKRKRIDWQHTDGSKPQFKNFKPRTWESIMEEIAESDTRAQKVRRPENGDNWKEQWMDWRDDLAGEDEESDVDVNRRRDVVIKVRRTVNGVERQRVERVVEEWVWSRKQTLTSPET